MRRVLVSGLLLLLFLVPGVASATPIVWTFAGTISHADGAFASSSSFEGVLSFDTSRVSLDEDPSPAVGRFRFSDPSQLSVTLAVDGVNQPITFSTTGFIQLTSSYAGDLILVVAEHDGSPFYAFQLNMSTDAPTGAIPDPNALGTNPHDALPFAVNSNVGYERIASPGFADGGFYGPISSIYVPEPSSAALLAGGLVALARARR